MTTTQDLQSHHMRVTSSGQMSVPAEVRRRWGTHRVHVIDHGDHLVVEPEPENPFTRFLGILAGPGPTYDEMKEEDRQVEAEREARRWPAT